MVSMINVVIVEDHRNMREALVDLIADAGHHVVAFESAEALWSGSNLRTVDIVVLDLNLPGVDGITVARRIRAEHPQIGIIILTARDKPEERNMGYENGADIYLAKPSSALELVGAVNALSRRLNRDQPKPATELLLDPFSMTLSGPTDTVSVSADDVDILTKFILAPDTKLAISEIASLWQSAGEISKSALEVRIVRLRKKMKTAGASTQPIKVIRNYGYKLTVSIGLKED